MATGRFYASDQRIRNEEDLRKMESFLREVHLQYRFPAPGEIVLTPQMADYLVTLYQRIKDALTALV